MHSFEKFKLQPTWKANWVGGEAEAEGKKYFFSFFQFAAACV
jgi:hypothetical protein